MAVRTTLHYDSSRGPAGIGEHSTEIWTDGIYGAIGLILDAFDRENPADDILKIEIDPNAEMPS